MRAGREEVREVTREQSVEGRVRGHQRGENRATREREENVFEVLVVGKIPRLKFVSV